MSGCEHDADGADSYHAGHPWEQGWHPLYLPPNKRAKSNWPPEPAYPAGPSEALEWNALPDLPSMLYGTWYREYGRR